MGEDPVGFLREAAENGNRKGGGLAGAGTGNGENVLAGEHVGDAAAPDGHGAAASEDRAGADGPRGEAEANGGGRRRS